VALAASLSDVGWIDWSVVVAHGLDSVKAVTAYAGCRLGIALLYELSMNARGVLRLLVHTRIAGLNVFMDSALLWHLPQNRVYPSAPVSPRIPYAHSWPTPGRPGSGRHHQQSSTGQTMLSVNVILHCRDRQRSVAHLSVALDTAILALRCRDRSLSKPFD
jgi:hypothetical protein